MEFDLISSPARSTISILFVFLCSYVYGDTEHANSLVYSQSQCQRKGSFFECNHIPRDLPEGVKFVRLLNVVGEEYNEPPFVRSGPFMSKSWSDVEVLEIITDEHNTIKTFGRNCFAGLKNLHTLRISISENFNFTNGTLHGLTNLKMLDLFSCRRFDLYELVESLHSEVSVSSLDRLNISEMGIYHNGVTLTSSFFKLLSDKKIKVLDMSFMQILGTNTTDFFENCEYLEYVRLSAVNLNSWTSDNDYVPKPCPRLKHLDLSKVVVPTKIATMTGTQYVSNKNMVFSPSWFSFFKPFTNVEYLDLSGFGTKTVIFENVTVTMIGIHRLKLKTIVLRNHHIDKLDLRINVFNSSIQTIDLSNCHIQYLNPGMLSSFDALTSVDLSRNLLGNMLHTDTHLFGNLFQALVKLRHLNLAENSIAYIPHDMFTSNVELVFLDLSKNKLTQVTFDMGSIRSIGSLELNLNGNLIKILDKTSINRLVQIRNLSLSLTDNPISCSSCRSLTFLKWLMESKFSTNLKCNDGKHRVNIDINTVHNVQHVCDKPKIVIGSIVSFIAVVIIMVTVVFVVRRKQRQRKHEVEMEDRVALIREGAREYEFLVFLSYCSKDDDFVDKYVYKPLNIHLQKAINETRDLVCGGDKHFRLGKPIHDQISLLLKRSSVVVVVLTNNYTSSEFCRNEFDQAFILEKPIVLMVKDELDTSLMTPLIKDIYEKNTRMLWKRENGEYHLKTSWSNVCLSITELVNIK